MEQKTQNKNKVIIALIAITLVVLLIGVWAFARYTTTVSGTGSAAVARWKFDANDSDAKNNKMTFTAIDLTTTMDPTPVVGKIAANSTNNGYLLAPGTKGSFDIALDTTNCDVAVEYTIELSNVQNKPANLKFYSDSARTTEITGVANNGDTTYTVTGYIAQGSTVTTKTLYWEWVYQAADAVDANDAQDTLDAGKNITFDITVTGVQSNPNTAVPTV